MRVTVFNLTHDAIGISSSAIPGSEELVVLPSLNSSSNGLELHGDKLVLRHCSKKEDDSSSIFKGWPINPEGFLIRISMALSASWQVIRVPDGCPWRVYSDRVTRSHHRLLVLPQRNLAGFLAEMPDRLPLSSLMLPGTHDTMAFYGWPISQCQSPSTPLSTQLLSGIRVLDIRLSLIKGRLIAYHGAYPQRTPFQSILGAIHAFLTSPTSCNETIVMSIKQEDYTITPSKGFSQCVRREMERGPGGIDMWFLENRIPLLGEVRGKVVLFSRFGGDGSGWENGLEGVGIHPTTWPDSAKFGFSWNCKDTLVRTHDWYSIPSFLAIPEKVELSTRILLPPTPRPPMPTLAITFFSAASFPLAFPPTIAQGFGWPKMGFGVEGVNSRVAKWLLDLLSGNDGLNEPGDMSEKRESKVQEEPRIRGWALMDYFDHPEAGGLVPLLVECNYRGRKNGEEGW